MRSKGKNPGMQRTIDKLVLGIAFIAPLVTLPQVFKVYQTRSAADISVLSWVLYVACAVPWFLYGIVHRDRRIIISTTLWIIFDVWIIVLALMYS
jgi:MtN3 and saliva related transmembrane protein